VTRLRSGQCPARVEGDGPVGQPGLFGNRVSHPPVGKLDYRERGVDQLIVLDSAVGGFRLDPGDDALARFEGGLVLHVLDHLCIVQVSVAEIKADPGVAHELTLPHGTRVDVGQVRQQQREQPAALAAEVYAQVMGEYQSGFVTMLRRHHSAELQDSNRAFFADVRDWWRPHHNYGVLRPMQAGITAALLFSPAQEFSRYWIAGDGPRIPRDVVKTFANAAWKTLRASVIEEDD